MFGRDGAPAPTVPTPTSVPEILATCTVQKLFYIQIQLFIITQVKYYKLKLINYLNFCCPRQPFDLNSITDTKEAINHLIYPVFIAVFFKSLLKLLNLLDLLSGPILIHNKMYILN